MARVTSQLRILAMKLCYFDTQHIMPTSHACCRQRWGTASRDSGQVRLCMWGIGWGAYAFGRSRPPSEACLVVCMLICRSSPYSFVDGHDKATMIRSPGTSPFFGKSSPAPHNVGSALRHPPYTYCLIYKTDAILSRVALAVF